MEIIASLNPIQLMFLPEEEKQLTEYLKDGSKTICTNCYWTWKTGSSDCFKNGKKDYFNANMALAGRDWLSGFLIYSDVFIQKAEATSATRASGFNRSGLLNLIGVVYNKKKPTPDRIYNCYKTISVSKSKCKINIQKSKKQVGALSSAENYRLPKKYLLTEHVYASTFHLPKKKIESKITKSHYPGTGLFAVIQNK